jgi:predicted  nucleic acid-binding Zn-ribbon protein
MARMLICPEHEGNPNAIRSWLDAASDEEPESGNYLLELTDDEISALHKEYVEAQMKVDDLKDELAEFTKNQNEKIKAAAKYQPEIMRQVRIVHREERGLLWRVESLEENKAFICNERGEVVKEEALRKMKGGVIVSMNKAASF